MKAQNASFSSVSVSVLQSALFVCRFPLTGNLSPHVSLCGSSWRPPATSAGSRSVPSSRAASFGRVSALNLQLNLQPAPRLLHLARWEEPSGSQPHQPISEVSAGLGVVYLHACVFKPLISDL